MALSRRGLFGGLFKAVLAAPAAAVVLSAPKAEPVALPPITPPPQAPVKFRVMNYDGASFMVSASGSLRSLGDGDYVGLTSLPWPEREPK